MSKQIYDALSVEGLKVILQQVSETCEELEIDFFIVGAIARNGYSGFSTSNQYDCTSIVCPFDVENIKDPCT